MTSAHRIPPPAPPAQAPWETCDHCQAPLDERQRYCVACGARRTRADDPAARYFVTAARRSRASAAAPSAAATAPRSVSGLRTAIVLALLPLAAGVGVAVGRHGKGDDQLLLEALKAQKAPVVNVSGGGAGAAAGTGAATGKAKAARNGGANDPDNADGKVLTHTRYGTARKLTGAKPTQAQLEESKQAIDRIVHSKGKEYVDSQRNLPDQIIIP
jgi:hypothetical protein